MHFSSSQKRLLRKLRKKPRLKSTLKKSELNDLVYLGDNGLIQYDPICDDQNPLNAKDHLVLLQPKGKAECAYIIEELCRWLIPVVISIFALLISILAIISSSQTISVYIDNQINSNFSTSITDETINAATENQIGKSG